MHFSCLRRNDCQASLAASRGFASHDPDVQLGGNVSASHLIGIDIGTTSVKAVMIDLSGQRVAEFSARYPTQQARRRPG